MFADTRDGMGAYGDTLATIVTVAERISGDEGCRKRLRAMVDSSGFQHGAYGFLNVFRVHLPICSDIPASWWRHYFAEGYMNSDPLVVALMGSRKPVDMKPLSEDPMFSRIWREDAGRFGLRPPCLGIPLHGPVGSTAAVVMFGDLPPFEHERKREIRKITQAGGEMHDEIMTSMGCEGLLGLPRLSEREKTALQLASSGMSVSLVADRMGISSKTVENYMKTAREKLGARNTVHAVARAVSMGLISTE